MAGVQDDRLAVAVSNAGGLGSVPCALLDGAQLDALLKRLTPSGLPINLNFFCHAMAEPVTSEEMRWRETLMPYYREFDIDPPSPSTKGARRPIDEATVDLLEAYRPAILSFHFGLPSEPLLARIRSWGATILVSATTVAEGLWLAQHGADLVIAQGIEAGGHRGHFLSNDLSLQGTTIDLVRQLRRAIDLPIVAAGGIGDRREAEKMFDAGASLVQAGTAYLLCPEATTSPVHRAAMQQPAFETAVTNLFSGRPARGAMNRLMRELGSLSTLPPAFPWASQALAPLRAQAEATGRGDFSPLWSGTTRCRYVDVDAAVITRDLAGAA